MRASCPQVGTAHICASTAVARELSEYRSPSRTAQPGCQSGPVPHSGVRRLRPEARRAARRPVDRVGVGWPSPSVRQPLIPVRSTPSYRLSLPCPDAALAPDRVVMRAGTWPAPAGPPASAVQPSPARPVLPIARWNRRCRRFPRPKRRYRNRGRDLDLRQRARSGFRCSGFRCSGPRCLCPGCLCPRCSGHHCGHSGRPGCDQRGRRRSGGVCRRRDRHAR